MGDPALLQKFAPRESERGGAVGHQPRGGVVRDAIEPGDRARCHPQEARDPHRDANGARITGHVNLTPRQGGYPLGVGKRNHGVHLTRPPRKWRAVARAARGRAPPAQCTTFVFRVTPFWRAARRPTRGVGHLGRRESRDRRRKGRAATLCEPGEGEPSRHVRAALW